MVGRIREKGREPLMMLNVDHVDGMKESSRFSMNLKFQSLPRHSVSGSGDMLIGLSPFFGGNRSRTSWKFGGRPLKPCEFVALRASVA